MKNFALVLASTLFTLLALEFGIRVIKHEVFNTENIIKQRVSVLRSRYPARYDAELGWTPAPTASSVRQLWVFKDVNIDASGIRSNGNLPIRDDRLEILAVGDSFVFGDEVSDDESWPARLQAAAGVRVINGGVFGYGLDQTYLRAERLVAEYRPAVLLVGLIPDDIYRCQLSVRNRATKPYFTVAGNTLSLHLAHMRDGRDDASQLDPLRRVLGHSQLVHSLMMRLNPGYWLQGRGNVRTVDNDPLQVSRQILAALERLASVERHVYIVIQDNFQVGTRELELVDALLAGRDARSFGVINLQAELYAKKLADPDTARALFGTSHMSSSGNQWVAEQILQRLRSDGVL